MKARAHFRIVGHDWHNNKRILLIEDLNGPMSVTNDAENVVADLLAAGHSNYRIVYRDSMGQWDELLHNGFRFIGFGLTLVTSRLLFNWSSQY